MLSRLKAGDSARAASRGTSAAFRFIGFIAEVCGGPFATSSMVDCLRGCDAAWGYLFRDVIGASHQEDAQGGLVYRVVPPAAASGPTAGSLAQRAVGNCGATWCMRVQPAVRELAITIQPFALARKNLMSALPASDVSTMADLT
jgi:hypothetical protein